jgi:hypothetical protein
VGYQGDCISSQKCPNTRLTSTSTCLHLLPLQQKRLQPIIDYSRSIRLIDLVHLVQLKLLQDRRQTAAKGAEDKKVENQHRKDERGATKHVKATL